jgi:hypothetical protein
MQLLKCLLGVVGTGKQMQGENKTGGGFRKNGISRGKLLAQENKN